jgi:hypothetical protein
VSEQVNIQIKPSDLRALLNTFKKMGQAANKDLRDASYDIARDVANDLKASAAGSNSIGGNSFQAQAVAQGIVPRRDRLAIIKISGKRQVASGGASVEDLLWGAEFGSNRYKQFPARSPREGRGNRGYFIFPTLKRLQPKIRKDWVNAVGKVADIWREANRG